MPSEIRHRVYEHYLSFTHSDFSDTLRPTHVYLDAAAPHVTALPSLMLACKRAHVELSSLVYMTAAMRVRRHGSRNEHRIGFAAHGAPTVPRYMYS